MQKHLWANLKYKCKINLIFGFSMLSRQCISMPNIALCINKFGLFGRVNIIFFVDFEPLNAIIPGNTNVEQCWSPLTAGFP